MFFLAHLNPDPVGPVLPRVLRPLEVQDRHQSRVQLWASGLVTSGLALHPCDLSNVGLSEVSLGNGALSQPPGEIIR